MFSACRSLFNICCIPGLVVLNFLNFCLFIKPLISPSILNVILSALINHSCRFFPFHYFKYGFPGGAVVKNHLWCRRLKRHRFSPWVRKSPWSRKCQPSPVFLPAKFHGQRKVVGNSPWNCRVRYHWTTELTLIHFKYSLLFPSGLQSFWWKTSY